MKTTVAALLISILVLGLSPASFAASPKPATGELTIAYGSESTQLDVTRAAAGVDWYINGNIYEQLLQPDPTLEIKHWLAEKWSLTEEDGHPVIDVQLRKGVKFHHGGELTSADMVFAQKRLANPDVSRWPHYQKNVDRIEVVDDHRFKIHFSKPDGLYIPLMLTLWGISKDYYEKVGDEGVQKEPDGTGPWKFVSRKVKEEFKLEAFDEYWNKEHRPGVKRLTIKIIPEDLTRVAALKTGAVDWIDAVPPAMIEEVKAMKDIATASRFSGNNQFVSLAQYLEKSPFRDVRVRRAVAHAIDVDGIIESVLFGQGQRYVTVTPGGRGHDPTLEPYAYDPKKARQLLAEAGYPNGFDVNCYNLITPREPNQKEYGEAVFAYLTQVGIRCNVVGEEYVAWLTRNRRSAEPHNDGVFMHMWGQGVVPDPGAPWSGHMHCYEPDKGWGSYSHYCDPELDKLIEEQASTMDPGKREELLKKIGKIKHEQVAGGYPTYMPLVTFAWRTTKVDYKPWPWGGFWRKLQEIGLKQ